MQKFSINITVIARDDHTPEAIRRQIDEAIIDNTAFQMMKSSLPELKGTKEYADYEEHSKILSMNDITELPPGSMPPATLNEKQAEVDGWMEAAHELLNEEPSPNDSKHIKVFLGEGGDTDGYDLANDLLLFQSNKKGIHIKKNSDGLHLDVTEVK